MIYRIETIEYNSLGKRIKGGVIETDGDILFLESVMRRMHSPCELHILIQGKAEGKPECKEHKGTP